MEKVSEEGETTETNNIDEGLESQLNQVQNENKKMRDEFNLQRAKMKELFLQKESECKKLIRDIEVIREELNEAKSQIIVDKFQRESEYQQDWKAQEEIASLQKLVQETIDESSFSKSEIDRLIDEVEKLKHENTDLRELLHSQQQDSPSLAPVISHVKKTIVRKLGGDSSSNDYLEDSMRKAQEDAEVLRSLVVPLEEEIKALKEKLRSADDELQQFRSLHPESIPNSSSNSNIDGKVKTLAHPEMCDNQMNTSMLPSVQCMHCESSNLRVDSSEKEMIELKQVNESLKKDVERFREELEKEGLLRRSLEEEWQEKRESHKKEVQTLTEKVTTCENDLAALQSQYNDAKDKINEELRSLTVEREDVYRYVKTLESDNDFLAGKYLATSEELQNQRIDLPNTVEELQELLLKCHESLIQARVGCEFEQRKCTSYLDEVQVLRDQLNSLLSERHSIEKEASNRIKILETQCRHKEVENERLAVLKDAFEKKEIEVQKEASELRLQVIELQEGNDKLNKTSMDLLKKVSVLQTELGNTEAVQKDFVRLSQSLQMELEKIRAADTCVRWQDDEDIENCPTCKSTFTVTRRKIHCRHCGTIYCEKCLTKTVPCGQRKRPARVCDVCHTLLVQNTAPYFSQAPPQSPT